MKMHDHLDTFMERWPQWLHNLSIPSLAVALSRQEMFALVDTSLLAEIGQIIKGRPVISDQERGILLSNLATRLDLAIDSTFIGGKAFIRLGSRSPKDSYKGHTKKFCVTSGVQAIELLIDSQRIVEDLLAYHLMNLNAAIYVRRWVDIAPWREWRCFVKQGKLIAVSQYHYHDIYPQLSDEVTNPATIIQGWFENTWYKLHRPMVPYNVVVDVALDSLGNVTVIEINPYCNWTDPCLLSWEKEKKLAKVPQGLYYRQANKEIGFIPMAKGKEPCTSK